MIENNDTTNVSPYTKINSNNYSLWTQSIKGKYIEIYYPIKHSASLPVVLYHCYAQEGLELWKICTQIGCSDFILIAVSHLDFQNDMTPWPAKGLSQKYPAFEGKADDYINILIKTILPLCQTYLESLKDIHIGKWCIAGYSLSGLFSLYTSTKLNLFTRVASVSGSLWYPGIVEYIKSQIPNSCLEKIYFSLGNKEKKARNQLFSSVEEKTKEIKQFYYKNNVTTIFEENEGNHFKDAPYRTAKAIQWILS